MTILLPRSPALVLRLPPRLVLGRKLGKLAAGLDIPDARRKVEAERDIPGVGRRPAAAVVRRAVVGRLELGTAGRGKAELDSQTHSLLEG